MRPLHEFPIDAVPTAVSVARHSLLLIHGFTGFSSTWSNFNIAIAMLLSPSALYSACTPFMPVAPLAINLFLAVLTEAGLDLFNIKSLTPPF
jgi:hypothetical protein